MDPKTTSALDPKLKEVYDRVMGTGSGASTPPSAVPSAPTTPTQGTPQASSPHSASTPSTNIMTPELTTSPTPATPPTTSVPPNSPASPAAPVTPSPAHGVSPAPTMETSSLSHGPTPPQPSALHKKSAIDYASLAAKYATPLPSINGPETPGPRPAVVSPSTTAYGVVNSNGASSNATKNQTTGVKPASSKKKLLLIIGLPILLVAYTIVWVVLFGVDIASLLPL